MSDGLGRLATYRRLGSGLLLGVSVLAISVAIVFSYLQRNVFDSARFADHAQASLAEQSVRDFASRALTDQVVTEIAPDAVAVGPLIEMLAGAAIQSDAFGRAFRSSVLQLHQAIVSGDTDGAVLTVANVGVLISGALERVAPGVARQIPDGFDTALVALANVRAVNTLVEAARISRTVSRVAWLVAFLSLLLAFLLSPRRRRLLRATGFSLVGAGVLLAVFWLLARSLVTHQVAGDDALHLAAARDLWETFMDGLLVDFLLLAALGAVLSASADGLLSGVNLERRLQLLLARAAQPPERKVLRVLWGLSALVLGFAIATNPSLSARLAVIVAGVLIGARGFQSLVVMLAPPEVVGDGLAAPAGRRRTGFTRRRKLILAGSALALVVVLLVAGRNYEDGLQALGIVPNTTACNGSESLCAKRIDQVALATTHNSMSEQTAPGFLFPAQEASIGKQLSDGIRGLQLDVYYGFPGTRVYTDADRSSPEARRVMKQEFGEEFVAASDRVRRSLSKPEGVAPQLFLCHGFCEIGATRLSQAAAQIRAFAEANPRELIAIVFEDHVPWQSLADALEEEGLSKLAYRGPWEGELPALGDVIGSGRRLLLLTENAEPDVPWMHNAYALFQETRFSFSSVAQLAAPSSCDEQRGSAENPMFLVNHWVDTPPNPRPSIARRVNAFDFLWKRVQRCKRERERFPNMIAVDFYRQGDLFRVVDRLNEVR
jgi:hypothetical protein